MERYHDKGPWPDDAKLSSASHIASRILRRSRPDGMDEQGFDTSAKLLQDREMKQVNITHQMIGKVAAGKEGNKKKRRQLKITPVGRTLQVRCPAGQSGELSRDNYPSDAHSTLFGHGTPADVMPYIPNAGISKMRRNRVRRVDIATPGCLVSGRR